ncbi:hypothetical protein KUTeg_009222, partial [Tegillarca granosa]
MGTGLELGDARVEFIADYVLKSMNLKQDKWMKMYTDECKQLFIDFFEKAEFLKLIIAFSGGNISTQYEWPTNPKAKACYFAKRSRDPLPKDPSFKNALLYGDLSYAPLDHLASFVDQVLVPVLSNTRNHEKWPQVVSADVVRHVDGLKNNVYVVSGQAKGKTLLPFPVGAEKIETTNIQKLMVQDRLLIHAIESVVIEWTHQIRDVLKRDSAQPLLEGLDPTPFVEIDFWKNKCSNLECIYEQLCNSKVKKMAELLQTTKSSYFPAFREVFQDVVSALDEAYDINLFLKPLRHHFEDYEQAEFDESIPLLGPMMHCVCLVWSNSQYYNTPARIVVILQEICNMIINQARNFLDPSEIFKGEVEETIDKVCKTVDVLHAFKETYEDHKSSLKNYFKDREPREWEFAPKLVFARFDKFMERVDTVKVLQMFEEFNEEYKIFTERTYDCLDPNSDEFLNDYNNFTIKIGDFDRRLATIICQAFDDCSGVDSVFKLIDIMGTLVDREVIRKDFDEKYPKIVQLMNTELDMAKLIYDEQMLHKKQTGKILLHKNMPKVSGSLKWAKELLDRIAIPMSSFRAIDHSWDNQVYSEWTIGVDQACSFNLNQPLLIRNKHTSLLSVNFDKELTAVLREVKYLEMRAQEEIPASASAVFAKNDTLWQYVTNLNLTVHLYNKVRNNVLAVEFPLIEGQLNDIDQELEQAETSLNWNSEGVWDYIQKIRDGVIELESNVQKAKNNVEEIQKLMATWNKAPLFERKEDKHDTLLNLDDKKERLEKRYNEIKLVGEKIHTLLQQNLEYYKGDSSTSMWMAYVEYIDEMILEGFFNTVLCSLNFLLDNTDAEAKGNAGALFVAQLELKVPDLVFSPSLDYGANEGFFDLVDGLIGDIYKQASLIPRLASYDEYEGYQNDVEDMEELSEMRQELMDRVQNIMNKANEYRNSFDTYSYLWVDDRNEFMKQFLLYNHVLTPEEIEANAEEGIPECPPTLEQFKEQIDTYETVYEEAEQIKATMVFDTWFKRWNIQYVSKMKHTLTEINNIAQSLIYFILKELEEFIKVTDGGLSKTVEEGDYQGLVDCMGFLFAVKERQAATDEMFEPLKQTIELLKTYEQEMSEEVHQQLQELPEQWNNTKKLSITCKQHVAPLQAIEVSNIRKKSATFDVNQHKFRETFRSIPPFRYNCETPYDLINEYHEEILAMETEMASLFESAGLFEVNTPDFKQLKQCRKEIKLLKNLWDYIFVVRSSIDDWKTTPFKKINVEQMDMDCKKFAKDIRSLDKEIRAWDSYLGLENTVKNMLTSIRAVAELQNPAIRDRHWQQLMAATKVRFVMNENTTLADLLSLNLHEFEDEVRNIVDKAVKEMSMEKVLKELDVTWSSMEFEHEKHPRTKITMLKTSEELIEILEDNQVQLQTMLTSKYIAHFLTEVSTWQKKLSTADQVIQIWMEVQRTWSHLESIFIGSEDIRQQLPEDSNRFDGIDSEFKELVSVIEKTKNVVEATSAPRLYERLDSLQGSLTLCEKALAEYLDTKRLAFPRFYFVSSADLLDILSNGNNPSVVSRHLTKLFDSMAALKFEQDEQGRDAKVGLGMYSKDGEYVELESQCDLSGQVEVWLNHVLESQIKTVRHEMTEAVVGYEEKPREQWLFDYPAQVALCATQIWWTTEIAQLNALITMLLGDLTKGDRQKIMTICTIDVHARDVVSKLILNKVDNALAFAWLSQLRHRWDDAEGDCFANICDAQFRYSHEYLGNTPRLVITPLTDRCYITLTQSLHLIMSGAPAGPAGTGKTETTKDLGRALGIMVYVFNCSEQMDYKSVGNIYMGLAQSGAWGCFDEFNRIAVEVLSVIAVQVKSIQDAIRDKRAMFNFMGVTIKIKHTVGIFITMNPGYAGRTELPENLKALFRPCAMVVPDFELICEIMLVAEGFLEARLLARKFITLYKLCKELLSKQVLMRALRDFNIPKIVTDDMPVFMGLIGDLFPALNVVQLMELFEVRHSVFNLGNAGVGKSKVWRTLHRTYKNIGKKPIAVDLDPKAVTNDELFGIINPATREWKDGLFSVIMRDLANLTGDAPKWIVLDGDIDPMWIESLNTVMDDNKVLTLASNERIALTPSMRLLFEISHLKTATPATVSRAGILFINPQDLGWNPYVQSWIDTREVQSERANLLILFDKYIPMCLDTMRTRFKKITPVAEVSHIQMLCYLLECLLTPENTPPDCPKELYELYFVFACVWAFGGVTFQDQTVKFPTQGTIFDYYIDPETKKFEPWTKKVQKFELDPDVPLQASLVHTSETTRLRYFLDMLIEKKRPVMLVGNAGTGKTVLMGDKLSNSGDQYLVTNVPFNFYTTSLMLQ